MPFINHSTYRAPFFLRNPHLQTILPQKFRKVKGIVYTRERIETPDDDFMDLDWSQKGNKRCAVLLHGLEGHSRRAYILGMVRALHKAGWDTVSVNMRTCSGEPNRQLRMYHHGVTDDVHTALQHIASTKPYDRIALVGFSLGGNLTLKYLGEGLFPIPDKLCCGVAFSTPCDLPGCARELDKSSNAIYMKRFLNMLHEKIIAKKDRFPKELNDNGYEKMRTFKEFDDRYTAPIHGFASAEDYWQKCASGQFLSGINIPALLINAADDPFLSPGSYPAEEAAKSGYLHFEMPKHGGHCGFITFGRGGNFWHEDRTIEFFQEHA